MLGINTSNSLLRLLRVTTRKEEDDGFCLHKLNVYLPRYG